MILRDNKFTQIRKNLDHRLLDWIVCDDSTSLIFRKKGWCSSEGFPSSMTTVLPRRVLCCYTGRSHRLVRWFISFAVIAKPSSSGQWWLNVYIWPTTYPFWGYRFNRETQYVHYVGFVKETGGLQSVPICRSGIKLTASFHRRRLMCPSSTLCSMPTS